MSLVLASSSPRRREILGFFAIEYTQVSPNFDEESIAFSGDPYLYATTLAEEKAKHIQNTYPDSVLISADTVVFAENQVLGKPKDPQDAKRMLQILSGKWHEVITGVSVVKKGVLHSASETTRVLCNPLTEKQIDQYLEIHHLLDKAGSYAIQKSGGLFVKTIEGCFYNVCGLPINTLNELLNQVGINLWDHLQEFDEAL